MEGPLDIVRRHEEWRLGECINLIPSENVTSPQVRELLASDMGHRYTLPMAMEIHGSRVDNAYRGTRYLDRIEAVGEALAREIFAAPHASLKPLSGHVAGFIMLLATCRRGDRVAVISPDHGGYDGYGRGYLPDILGLEVRYLPFREDRWNLDTEAAARMVESWKPRLVILGQSLFLFPYDMKPVRHACDAAGSSLGYDASHVLGLIAGGIFQAPLREGADIVVGSTHKSFFGPQGGLLLVREGGMWEAVQRNLVWRSLDNAHWNRVAALAQALLEAREVGAPYASQVVANARALGRQLHDQGVPVRFPDLGFTSSHQVLLDPGGLRGRFGLSPNDAAVRLEAQDIIVDAVGRLGTNEVTRMGAREEHMGQLAGIMAEALAGKQVGAKVKALRASLGLAFTLPTERGK